MYSREEKLKFMKGIMWDYNIPPGHCLEVLEGTRKNAGHYNEATLFRKLIESYPWFTILNLLPLERLLELMTDKTIQSLRFKSITTHYEFIRSRLQKNLQLKTEFVNDIAYRWGKTIPITIGTKNNIPVDNIANILANKLTAMVSRDEPKDVFDIISISCFYHFNWKEIYKQAFEKQIMNEADIAMRLSTFPSEWMVEKPWLIEPVNRDEIKSKLEILADDFLFARDNSLGVGKMHILEAKPMTTDQ